MKILCALGKYAYGDPSRGESYEYANFLPAFAALGHEVKLFDSLDRYTYAEFYELNKAFLAQVHDWQPDLIFCVLMHYEIWTNTLDAVRAGSTAAVVNWGTDDSWKYAQFARFIAPHVDVYATTSSNAARRAWLEGFDNVMLTQWAADSEALASPLPAAACRYGATFIGSAYGDRRRWVGEIQRQGAPVTCFGHGWPGGAISTAEMRRIVRQSLVSLNFSDSSRQWRGMRITAGPQIKARVFEVPGAGGVLLTQVADGLEDLYHREMEIEVFHSAEEAASKIARLLNDPASRDRMAQAGHKRTADEHTYVRRFPPLLDEAMRRSKARARFSVSLPPGSLPYHPAPWWLPIVRIMLVWPAIILFGKKRGPRAARRALFELTWRVAGKHTYSARGWPGRMFFRES
jgi:spore maturation protein CgeB